MASVISQEHLIFHFREKKPRQYSGDHENLMNVVSPSACVRVCARAHMCIHVSTCVHLHPHVFVCVRVRMCASMHVCLHVHVFKHQPLI